MDKTTHKDKVRHEIEKAMIISMNRGTVLDSDIDNAFDLIDKLYEERCKDCPTMKAQQKVLRKFGFRLSIEDLTPKDMPQEYANKVNKRFWDLV